MNRIQLLSPIQTFSPAPDEADEKPPFSLVIIYDHEAAATEASCMLERLLLKYVPSLDIHCDALSFSEILHAELRAETIALARECDVLALATLSRDVTVPAVAQWLDLWGMRRAQKETALISLASSASTETTRGSLHDHLKQIADSQGLVCFSSSFKTNPDACLHNGCASRPQRIEYVARPEGWGINE
jgi:hypothetical protein